MTGLLSQDPPGNPTWDRHAKRIIGLLVDAVLTMPEHERRQIISQTMTLLLEAALTLPEIPGDGLIALSLAAGGYQDHLRRLWPPKDTQREVAPDSSDAALENGGTRNVL